MLNKDRLRFTQLAVQAGLFAPPSGPVIAPQAIGPKDVSAIYAELARYGFAAFQLVPGGAQMATADRVSMLTITGAGWTYQEDLSRSEFELALDKLDVAINEYVTKLPAGTMMVNQVVDLQAHWETGGEPADRLISQIYLKDAVARLAGELGLDFQGSGIRMNLARPAVAPFPGGMQLTGPEGQAVDPKDSFDVRVEPLFADKAKLFLQVTGIFASTSDLKAGDARIRFVRELLWDRVASHIALE